MRTLKDIKVNNKTVILRCDLNVSISNGKIIDDTKIRKSLKTIEYLLDNNAKVLIMSHLGKIKNEKDKDENNMLIVYKRLKSFLNEKIEFIDATHGLKLKKKIKDLDYGKALLMQNTRYEDLNNNKESDCNKRLAKSWSKLGDIYVNDAFGSIHRKHASNYGISLYLPSAVGFLVEEELKNLNILDNPKRPFGVIMGGSKISDKIKVIDTLAHKADYIIIGGAMAFPFLVAKGHSVGASLYDEKEVPYCKKLLERYEDKIILPIDLYGIFEVGEDENPILYDLNSIPKGFIGLDIGDETIKKFKSILLKTKTIFWNGPLGRYEYDNFKYGTEAVLKYLINNVETVILGGGDIVSCATVLGLSDKVSFISTGGGATLKYLEDHNQPGLENIK